MCSLLYTNLQNKTQYRGAVRFARSQKSQHKYSHRNITHTGNSEKATYFLSIIYCYSNGKVLQILCFLS